MPAKLPLRLLLVPALGAAALAAEPATAPPRPAFTAEIAEDQFLAHVATLADDAMGGRESGTAEGRLAEEYVAKELARMGLEPLGTDAELPGATTVRLPWRVPLPSDSSVEVRVGGAAPHVAGGAEGTRPFAFSHAGEAAGGLVFAGFGISRPDLGYDDYADADVRGKVVLALRHGPGEQDAESPFGLVGRPASRADAERRRDTLATMSFTAKAAEAARRGAAALLLVNDLNHAGDALPTGVAGDDPGLPVLAVSRALAERLLAPAGLDLRELQQTIDASRRPRTREVQGVEVRVKAALGADTARNVLFVRRGSDPALRDEAVLVCAHLDHVGRGWFGSPAGGGEIHNGADDNASGTAALLEIAESLAAGPAPRRSVLFAAWCGEEKGLVGSQHFAANPAWPLDGIVACLNLDMVGRYREPAGLSVGGAVTGSGLAERVERLAGRRGVALRHSWEAWEQSDHVNFYRARVPALFFHTGLHADYHRPPDDWWKVESAAGARIAALVADLARELADADERPAFAEKPPRPVLGVQLADASEGGGAAILGVMPGLGAAQAGLEPRDVVVEIAGKPVRTAADLSAVVGEAKPGDVVDLVYLRGEERRTAKVKVSGV